MFLVLAFYLCQLEGENTYFGSVSIDSLSEFAPGVTVKQSIMVEGMKWGPSAQLVTARKDKGERKRGIPWKTRMSPVIYFL